jgi:hypothetical protein
MYLQYVYFHDFGMQHAHGAELSDSELDGSSACIYSVCISMILACNTPMVQSCLILSWMARLYAFIHYSVEQQIVYDIYTQVHTLYIHTSTYSPHRLSAYYSV